MSRIEYEKFRKKSCWLTDDHYGRSYLMSLPSVIWRLESPACFISYVSIGYLKELYQYAYWECYLKKFDVSSMRAVKRLELLIEKYLDPIS